MLGSACGADLAHDACGPQRVIELEGDVESVVQAHGSELRFRNVDDHVTLFKASQFEDRLTGRDGLARLPRTWPSTTPSNSAFSSA